jgi:hypothetical protein
VVWWKAAHAAGRYMCWTKAIRIVGDTMLRDNYETQLMVLVKTAVLLTVSG